MLLPFFIYRANDPAAKHMGYISFIGWTLGVSVWISDRTMCNFWIQMGKMSEAVCHVTCCFPVESSMPSSSLPIRLLTYFL